MAALGIEDVADEHEAALIMHQAIETAIKFDAYTSAPIHTRIQYAR